jgi:hypothetical protein
MDPTRLIAGYRSILENIYSSGEYYRRSLECLRRVSNKGAEPNRYNVVSGVMALSKIIVRLGFLDRERKEFWKYFRRSLLEHRDNFAHSMRLAAMGYHFRKLNENL